MFESSHKRQSCRWSQDPKDIQQSKQLRIKRPSSNDIRTPCSDSGPLPVHGLRCFFPSQLFNIALFSQISCDGEGRRGCLPHAKRCPFRQLSALMLSMCRCWSCCAWIELLESLVFEVAHHRTSLVCFQCSCTFIFKEIRAWLDEENNWEDYARRCSRLEENGWLMSRLSIRSELRSVDFELNIHPSSFARFPDCWRESLEWNFIP